MFHIDTDAISRVRELKDKAKESDKEHYINFCYYHPELFSKEQDEQALSEILGFPGYSNYEYTLCPSEKMRNRRGASHKQIVFEDICEYGIEGICLCYCLSRGRSDYADLSMSEEAVRSLCRRCDHYRSRGFDDWDYCSIYHPKVITEKYKHYVASRDAEAYVYFVSDGHYVKIGKAQDPIKRLGQIQTGNPNQCELLYLIPLKASAMASEVESYLHEKYKQHRMCGEWFNLLEKLHHEKWEKMFPPKLCKKSEQK